MENEKVEMTEAENPDFGFKCLHYSVTESAGTVEVTIKRKHLGAADTVGVRTVDGTAVAPKDYGKTDTKVTFKPGQELSSVKIPIVDDDAWNPDLEFNVELYDITSEELLKGGDTVCKITILDEDFPGTIEFVKTDLQVSKNAKFIDVEIHRIDGSDGTIHCQIQTEVLADNSASAQPFEDFIPIQSIITFPHAEIQKTVRIELAKPNPMEEEAKEGKKVDDEDSIDEKKDSEEQSESDEDQNLMFSIRLSDPKPEGAKISRNNVCNVIISQSEEFEEQQEIQQKLLEIYLSEKEPNWGKQFVDACVLGPVVNEDGELEEPSYWDAFSHFCAIFWKVFFALVPPAEYGGGYPSFVASLTMIGIVTYIVGDVATVLGCALGIKESVTAITFVALGTSLPDTFASMTAARESDYADSAIGNITGSNSVNVFLGLGLPWLMGCIYW